MARPAEQILAWIKDWDTVDIFELLDLIAELSEHGYILGSAELETLLPLPSAEMPRDIARLANDFGHPVWAFDKNGNALVGFYPQGVATIDEIRAAASRYGSGFYGPQA